jgi:hypothetical protein
LFGTGADIVGEVDGFLVDEQLLKAECHGREDREMGDVAGQIELSRREWKVEIRSQESEQRSFLLSSLLSSLSCSIFGRSAAKNRRERI